PAAGVPPERRRRDRSDARASGPEEAGVRRRGSILAAAAALAALAALGVADRSAGWAGEGAGGPRGKSEKPKDRGRSMRFLALGDSYTIGEGVAPAERWPVQLAALLRAKGVALDEPEIVARTGWTADELKAGIAAAGPRGPFDLVTLLIGVNDQYRGHPVEGFRPSFRALLAQAVGFAGGDPVRRRARPGAGRPRDRRLQRGLARGGGARGRQDARRHRLDARAPGG